MNVFLVWFQNTRSDGLAFLGDDSETTCTSGPKNALSAESLRASCNRAAASSRAISARSVRALRDETALSTARTRHAAAASHGVHDVALRRLEMGRTDRARPTRRSRA